VNRLGKTSAVNIMNVKEYLERYGYDGLDCGCLVEKFILCYAYTGKCKPGIKKIVDGDWIITPNKNKWR